MLTLDSTIRAPEKDDSHSLKDKVRQPKNQMRRKVRARFQRLSQDEETVVDHDQDQRDGDPDAGFASMRPDAKGNAHQRKRDAREGKCDLAMELHAGRKSQIELSLGSQVAHLLPQIT